MDDFMDSLVKEVEGNIKPIRSEKMDDPFDAPKQSAVKRSAGQPIRAVKEPVSQPVPQPVSQSVPQPAPEPALQPVPQPFSQPAPQPIPQPAPQSSFQSSMQPSYQGLAQPVYQMNMQPQPIFQEPFSQPVYQAPMPRPLFSEPAPVMEPAAPREEKKEEEAEKKEKPSDTSGINKDLMNEVEKDLFLHVHRENVKCYRNTQATIIENTNMVKQGLEDKHSNIHQWLLILLVLSLVNLGANALLILHMIFGFL
ncbi:MAG: hypothetical protein K5668_01615 [Lachnospiraceae bacterium]|nr:hypothetical protein [Lachnospiraceae bacterium]